MEDLWETYGEIHEEYDNAIAMRCRPQMHFDVFSV